MVKDTELVKSLGEIMKSTFIDFLDKITENKWHINIATFLLEIRRLGFWLSSSLIFLMDAKLHFYFYE